MLGCRKERSAASKGAFAPAIAASVEGSENRCQAEERTPGATAHRFFCDSRHEQTRALPKSCGQSPRALQAMIDPCFPGF